MAAKKGVVDVQEFVEVQECEITEANRYLELGYRLVFVSGRAAWRMPSTNKPYVHRDVVYTVGRTADVDHGDSLPEAGAAA